GCPPRVLSRGVPDRGRPRVLVHVPGGALAVDGGGLEVEPGRGSRHRLPLLRQPEGGAVAHDQRSLITRPNSLDRARRSKVSNSAAEISRMAAAPSSSRWRKAVSMLTA